MDAIIIELASGLGLENVLGFFPPILAGIVNVAPLLLSLFFYADKSKEFNINSQQQKFNTNHQNEEYDFIIAGGGSAGCVLASRLSGHFPNVLLLESGGEPNPLTTVPGLQGVLVGRPETDYSYLTVPQRNSCLAMNNRQCMWSAGIGLGGTSMMNGMIYVRGHPYDYDRWARHAKDNRWNYNNLLPYFLRSEGFCDSCDPSEGVKPIVNWAYHNTKGELSVRPPPLSNLVPEFLSAHEWGGVHRGDLNAPYFEPTADSNVITIKRGRRMSAYHSFVEPLLGKRDSLKIKKYARVIEVLFEHGTNKAIGVKYERFGKIEVVKATKEVILSAGTLATPKILMLSGIGPADHLKALNISVRCNLPVGNNLQNHIGAHLGPFLIDQPLSTLSHRDWDAEAVKDFFVNGTGPISVSSTRAYSWWLSERATSAGEDHWPDIQIQLNSNGVGLGIVESYERSYNAQSEIMRGYFDPIKGRDAFTLYVTVGRPHGRGTIRLKSSNFKDDPLIDPRYYEESDIKVLIEGIQRALYMVNNAPSYQKIGARLSPIPFPTCKNLEFQSEAYWECFVRQFTTSIHHYVGTAAMGAKGSPDAVVDPELNVIGVSSLRVIDASIMPYLPTANTNAASIMIGERGADFIIAKYLKRS